jgi:alpha-beta hydrolase superfamily lysophospholipase
MAPDAPLIATADAPVPAGASAAWIARGDARLRAALFAPVGRPRGSVVLSGGRTEPIEKYFEVIEELRARGLTVLAHDWRGQGLSQRRPGDRLKGHGEAHEDLLEDLMALVDRYRDRLPPPRVAIGHSMGGCVTLLALTRDWSHLLAGAVLSAPMLGLRTGPLPLALARLAARVRCMLGGGDHYVAEPPIDPFTLSFEGNHLTHDRVRFARHRAQLAACPDLALGGPTWSWLDASFAGMALVAHRERLRAVQVPVAICAAQRDTVVDNAALRRAARWLPRGRLVEVPGARHEILMETDERRAFFWWAFDDLVASLG